MPEQENQNLVWIKGVVQKKQLAFIFDDCFSTNELTKLVEDCFAGFLEVNLAKVYEREFLIHWLVEKFFYSLSSFHLITKKLSQKSDLLVQRIGYMNTEEIYYFCSCFRELSAQGIGGKTIWSLLIDKRQNIQKHGANLLKSCSYLDFVPNRFRNTNIHEEWANKNSDRDQEQIDLVTDKLKDRLDELKVENDKIKHQNKQLKGQLEFSTQEYVNLEISDNSRKKELTAVEDYEAHISSIEFEKEQLRQKLTKQSLELRLIQNTKQKRDELDLELSTLEDLQSRSQKLFHRMISDFESSVDKLEWIHQGSNKTLRDIKDRLSSSVQNIDTNEEDTKTIAKGPMGYFDKDQPRVGVFVDVQNMFYAAKDRYDSRLDYIKLLDLTVGPRHLVVAYAYIVQIPEIDQSSFLSLLEHNGYRIKTKDLRLRGDGSAKGDWDVGIAIDIVSMLDMLDVVILASGDGDFCPLVELIQQKNKRIEVIAFEHNTAMDLQRKVDKFYPVSSELLI